MIRPCTSGPKFFPSNWCGSSSVDERSSCREDPALPSTDDPDYNDALPDEVQPGLPVTDEAFEAMLQSFDQDAYWHVPSWLFHLAQDSCTYVLLMLHDITHFSYQLCRTSSVTQLEPN